MLIIYTEIINLVVISSKRTKSLIGYIPALPIYRPDLTLSVRVHFFAILNYKYIFLNMIKKIEYKQNFVDQLINI